MSFFTRFATVGLLLTGAAASLAACQSLAGIEDRTFDGPAAPSALCQQYCSLAKSICTGNNAIYSGDETCLSTCRLLDPGDELEPGGNTVACRISQLNNAEQDSEADSISGFCAAAGPGGNGKCGSNCVDYCALYVQACSGAQAALVANQYADQDLCVSHCKGLTDTPKVSLQSSYTMGGDNLQCRLAHLSAAASAPETHCGHAQLQVQSKPDPKNSGPCVDDPDANADCNSYCELERAECVDEFAQYESEQQCQAVCHALKLGKVGDTTQNTVGCRRYHSYNALLPLPDGPAIHCSHTGPGGDGHCGAADTGNCESYCMLAGAACNSSNAGLATRDTFAAHFKNPAACLVACSGLDGAPKDSKYVVSPAPSGDNLQCRFLHVSRALVTEAAAVDECASVFGEGDCQ
jgi:hypothetical protein